MSQQAGRCPPAAGGPGWRGPRTQGARHWPPPLQPSGWWRGRLHLHSLHQRDREMAPAPRSWPRCPPRMWAHAAPCSGLRVRAVITEQRPRSRNPGPSRSFFSMFTGPTGLTPTSEPEALGACLEKSPPWLLQEAPGQQGAGGFPSERPLVVKLRQPQSKRPRYLGGRPTLGIGASEGPWMGESCDHDCQSAPPRDAAPNPQEAHVALLWASRAPAD